MGFRFGVGKKIGGINFFLSKSVSTSKASKNKNIGNKSPTASELKDREFNSFLHKSEKDANELIMDFFELNGYDPSRLRRENIDIDELFENDESYEIFSDLTLSLKEEIEKVAYSGDTGIQAKRDIAEKLFALKAFINRYEKRDHINPKYAFLKQPEPQSEPIPVQINTLVNESSFDLSSVLNKINNNPIVKNVGLICLWIGILIMPYIFAWGTLSKNFTRLHRVIDFSWMAVVLILIITGNKE